MQCSKYKADQSPCQAQAMQGSSFCYLHNPEVDPETKNEARARGGRGNRASIAETLPALPLQAPRDVVKLLEDTINRVRNGEIDLKAANCLGYLAGHLAKAMEVAELETRLTKIEKSLSFT